MNYTLSFFLSFSSSVSWGLASWLHSTNLNLTRKESQCVWHVLQRFLVYPELKENFHPQRKLLQQVWWLTLLKVAQSSLGMPGLSESRSSKNSRSPAPRVAVGENAPWNTQTQDWAFLCVNLEARSVLLRLLVALQISVLIQETGSGSLWNLEEIEKTKKKVELQTCQTQCCTSSMFILVLGFLSDLGGHFGFHGFLPLLQKTG